jgi:hypothetical protein
VKITEARERALRLRRSANLAAGMGVHDIACAAQFLEDLAAWVELAWAKQEKSTEPPKEENTDGSQ